jgi:hypothetical protein
VLIAGRTAYGPWKFLRQDVGPTDFGATEFYHIMSVVKIYTRQYRELYQCCDACDQVYWKWGSAAPQGGTTESSITDQGGQIDATLVGGGGISVPSPYPGVRIPIPFLSIPGVVYGHSQLNWKPTTEPGITPLPTVPANSPPEDLTNTGYTVLTPPTPLSCTGAPVRAAPDPARFN